MGVVGEVIQASRMPNGTVTTTVAALDDDVVEAEERFAVMGQVTPTGFPVVFNSAASVAIIDNESMYNTMPTIMCVIFSHIHYYVCV